MRKTFAASRFADHAMSQRGNNDLLTLTAPELMPGYHRAFLEAGADFIETNTFNSTSISQADYGLEAEVYELNEAAAAHWPAGVADEVSEQTPGTAQVCDWRAGPDQPHGVPLPGCESPGFPQYLL